MYNYNTLHSSEVQNINKARSYNIIIAMAPGLILPKLSHFQEWQERKKESKKERIKERKTVREKKNLHVLVCSGLQLLQAT